jgi:hypothetical protein
MILVNTVSAGRKYSWEILEGAGEAGDDMLVRYFFLYGICLD